MKALLILILFIVVGCSRVDSEEPAVEQEPIVVEESSKDIEEVIVIEPILIDVEDSISLPQSVDDTDTNEQKLDSLKVD